MAEVSEADLRLAQTLTYNYFSRYDDHSKAELIAVAQEYLALARAEGYRAGVEDAAKVADKIGYWDDLEGIHDGQKVATAIRALAETGGKE